MRNEQLMVHIKPDTGFQFYAHQDWSDQPADKLKQYVLWIIIFIGYFIIYIFYADIYKTKLFVDLMCIIPLSPSCVYIFFELRIVRTRFSWLSIIWLSMVGR